MSKTKLTIYGNSHEELAASIAKLHQTFNGQKTDPASKPATDKPGTTFRANEETEKAKADKPATASKPPATTKAAVANVAKPAAKVAPKAAAKDDAYEPVRVAIMSAIADGHRKSVKDMLAQYDAANGQDLDPSVYDEVLAKLAVITGSDGDLA